MRRTRNYQQSNAAVSSLNPLRPASLWVGDLHQEVSEWLLFEIFNLVGPVQSIKVCRDSVTRKSLGYAYVNFHELQDAQRALDTMNFTEINSRPCRITWSQRDSSLRKSGVGNLFVKNLAPSVDNKGLFETFSAFGNILSCKVAADENGISKGHGYVHFETAQAAQDAIQALNGCFMEGMKLTVVPHRNNRHNQLIPATTDEEAQNCQSRATMMAPQFPGGPMSGPFGSPRPGFRFPGNLPPFMQSGGPQMPHPAAGGHPVRYSSGRPQAVPKPPGMVGPGMSMQDRGPGWGMPFQPGGMPPQGPMDGPMKARGVGPADMMGGPRHMYPPNPAQMTPQIQHQAQQQMRSQVRFNNQVRNQNGPGMMQPMPGQQSSSMMMQHQAQQQAGGSSEFSNEALASADPHTQKNIIGERLYPLIREHQPKRAGKITGMLLEMDTGELLNLIESPDALLSKIDEALRVLLRATDPSTVQPMPMARMTIQRWAQQHADSDRDSSDSDDDDDVSDVSQSALGECLYALVQEHQPEQAGRITGMLLELGQEEVLLLLGSNDALMSKIEEALSVLRPAPSPALAARRATPAAPAPAAPRVSSARASASEPVAAPVTPVTTAEQAQPECIICLTGRPSHAIIPCGHRCLCDDAACTAAFQPSRRAKCPLCRTPVQGLLHVFL